MPGALTHIITGVLLAAIVHWRHFKLEYSLSIFLGSLLPDVIKFGVTAIKQLTWNIFGVNQNDLLYQLLRDITYSYDNWFTLGFFVFGTALLLYHYHYIKEKTMEEYDELYVFLLIGVILHIVMDAFIIESGPWI